MTDLVIPDLPDEVISAIDKKAKALGLTRVEYARRLVSEQDETDDSDLPELTIEDMRRYAELIQDLKNPEIMRKAWE
jgi:hypothetical protein